MARIGERAAYGDKCDVWSMGCILYELCSLRPPFGARNTMDLFAKIRSGVYEPLASATYSAGTVNLVAACLAREP